MNELKALGLKTFLMPLMPGKDTEGTPIDYSSTAMDGVWEAIEEAGVPVSHHIGENPPATPIAFNALQVGMFQAVAPFRDTFGKYVLGGILDRHPGLRVGYFEGGINWVPSALQDAEHIAASFRHLADLKIEHEPTYYWDNHMCASFMVDPAWARASGPHRRGPGDVVDRLPTQREHLRLQQSVAGLRRGRRRSGRDRSHRRWQREALPRDRSLMPDIDVPSPEEIILYEKDPATRIATITLNRPDQLNIPTIGARRRYADLLFKASIDDDVKVLVVRGVGDHLGSGADLDELMAKRAEGTALHEEFGIDEDEDVTMPFDRSYRAGASLLHWYGNTRSGCRTLQDFKKISILEVKGYCYGWHFYQAADADLVISSDDALFGHPAFRYVGYAPRMWQWAMMMGMRKFQEMVFTGRPFTAEEMYECNFVNSVVPRAELEAETEKYALACSKTRPTDTIFMQKVFFEIMKQHQGEYMGSLLSAWLESMGGQLRDDVAGKKATLSNETMEAGLNLAVKDNDSNFPPEWRLSRSGRRRRDDG